MSSQVPDEKNRFALIQVTCSQDCDFKDHADAFGVEMSLIHNVFIRCLNCIYYYAPRVKKGDERPFAGYCLVLTEALYAHHREEEELVFPFLQSKFDMNRNLEQHAIFKSKITDFEDYIRAVRDEKETLDGEKVRNLVEKFGDDLVEHLHEEIPTISPERLKEFDKNGFDEMMNKHMEYSRAFPLTTAVILLVTHHDFKAIPTWPPMPAPIRWISRNIAYWRHRSYWKFAPFTRFSEPLIYA